MAYPLLTQCPICEGELQATRLNCVDCHSQVEGDFDLGGLLRLSREQGYFVELLVKGRGNINRVADELGVSYTTARNRMDDIVAALGYTAVAEAAPVVEQPDALAGIEPAEVAPVAAIEVVTETS